MPKPELESSADIIADLDYYFSVKDRLETKRSHLNRCEKVSGLLETTLRGYTEHSQQHGRFSFWHRHGAAGRARAREFTSGLLRDIEAIKTGFDTAKNNLDEIGAHFQRPSEQAIGGGERSTVDAYEAGPVFDYEAICVFDKASALPCEKKCNEVYEKIVERIFSGDGNLNPHSYRTLLLKNIISSKIQTAFLEKNKSDFELLLNLIKKFGFEQKEWRRNGPRKEMKKFVLGFLNGDHDRSCMADFSFFSAAIKDFKEEENRMPFLVSDNNDPWAFY